MYDAALAKMRDMEKGIDLIGASAEARAGFATIMALLREAAALVNYHVELKHPGCSMCERAIILQARLRALLGDV